MKMPIYTVLLFFSALLLGSCDRVVDPEGELKASALVIRTGTSFGMCLGYCWNEVEMIEQQVKVLSKSFREQEKYQDKACSSDLSREDWQALQQALNQEAFVRLPETIGCPDCADGGAEWIEIEEGDKKHRVTFEYNSNIPEIQPFLDRVRSIRSQAVEACR